MVVLALLTMAGPAAAEDLTIEVGAPEAVALGENVPVTVSVRSSATDAPVSGAIVIFHAVKSFAGVEGDAILGSATTNDAGVAGFTIKAHVAGLQGVRAEVIAAGQAQSESILIPVTKGEQLHRSETGVDLPGIGAWLVVVVVAAAWFIMQVAGRNVLTASRIPNGRDVETTDESQSGHVRGSYRVSHLATVMMTVTSLMALGIVVLLLRGPETRSNLHPEGYDRTPVAFLEARYGYAGLGLADDALDPTEEPTGRTLFLGKGCAGCHGTNAEGTASAPTPAWTSAERLTEIVRVGSVGMPSYGPDELSDMELDAIFTFLLEARASPIVRERSDALVATDLPVTSGGEIPTFTDNVGPILAARCGTCHGSAGGWSAADYESVMNSGTNSPVIVPGDPENSLLAQKLLGVQQTGAIMPPSGALPDAEVSTIIDWIAAGADE